MRFSRKIQVPAFATALLFLAIAGYSAGAGHGLVSAVAWVSGFALLGILFVAIREQLEARRKNDVFLESIFENIPNAIWVKDAATLGVHRINRAGEELFGSRREIEGKTAFELFPEEQAQAIDEQDRAILSGMQMVDVVEKLEVAAGSRWLHIKKIPLFDDRGNPEFLLGIGEDITEEKEAGEDYRRVTTQQLRALAARIESAREEEKSHIAREIHDVLGQELTVLKLDAGWVLRRLNAPENPLLDPLTARLRTMLKQIDSTMGTVRRLATDLRPGALDELGLSAALAQHAQDFEERANLKVIFHSCPEEQARAVPKTIATALFRIFQELLTNVARHASAKKVIATLSGCDAVLELTVQDDGIGISDERASSGDSLGLLGVRERAHLLGGEVKIVGTQGEGTTVVVRVPCHENSAG